MNVGRMRLLVLGRGGLGSGGLGRLLVQQVHHAGRGHQGQWGQVEVLLQRRSDLIPNLVEATKAFAKQERDVVPGRGRCPSQDGRRLDAGERRSLRQMQNRVPWPSAGRRRGLPAAEIGRDVHASDGRAHRSERTASLRSGDGSTTGFAEYTRAGGGSRPTSRPASSGSRNTPTSKHLLAQRPCPKWTSANSHARTRLTAS